MAWHIVGAQYVVVVVVAVGMCSRHFRYPVCLEGRKGRSGNDTGEVVVDFFGEGPEVP